MKKGNYINKCVSITTKQDEFLSQERVFMLSKFLQSKLDDYIRARKEYKKFMEVKDEKTVE